jgi:hypothetical protein
VEGVAVLQVILGGFAVSPFLVLLWCARVPGSFDSVLLMTIEKAQASPVVKSRPERFRPPARSQGHGMLGEKGGSRMRHIGTGLALLALFVAIRPAAAQTAALVGTVKDPTQGLVPQANVTLTNLATGVNVGTVTDNAGNYECGRATTR